MVVTGNQVRDQLLVVGVAHAPHRRVHDRGQRRFHAVQDQVAHRQDADQPVRGVHDVGVVELARRLDDPPQAVDAIPDGQVGAQRRHPGRHDRARTLRRVDALPRFSGKLDGRMVGHAVS